MTVVQKRTLNCLGRRHCFWIHSLWQPRLEATLAAFTKTHPRLELQPQRELNLPGITGGSDFAKGSGRRERCCRVVERRSVEEIKDIGAKLHLGVFARQE